MLATNVTIMSLMLEVSLISGKTVSLQAHEDESVESLRLRAQRALGKRKGRLVNSNGSVPDGVPLKQARLQQAEPLTLLFRSVEICGNSSFAAILGDGSVVTWGEADDSDEDDAGGGRVVLGQLNNVQQIQATGGAFAAILTDGSVVTWGDADAGGDSRSVSDKLKNVQQIQATRLAFAAIVGDGSVVTWGHADFGGDSSAVRDQLKNVQHIQSSLTAFAAILGDGSVVTWGRAAMGGDSSAVRDKLRNVQQVQSAEEAFAAILGDGSVVTWGMAQHGGDSSGVRDQLKNVQQIQAAAFAFAAILGDGSVVTWGDAVVGGDSSAVQDQLKNVQQIQANRTAFAAIPEDGSVVTWGIAQHGGDSTAVRDQLKNVQQIQATRLAFAAIVGDGSVVTWGHADFGGDSSAVRDQLKNVQQIQATRYAFAILGNGLVVTWGSARFGGDSSAVQGQLKNVQHIQATSYAFAAILGDDSVVTWGVPQCKVLLEKVVFDALTALQGGNATEEDLGVLQPELVLQENYATQWRNLATGQVATVRTNLQAQQVAHLADFLYACEAGIEEDRNSKPEAPNAELSFRGLTPFQELEVWWAKAKGWKDAGEPAFEEPSEDEDEGQNAQDSTFKEHNYHGDIELDTYQERGHIREFLNGTCGRDGIAQMLWEMIEVELHQEQHEVRYCYRIGTNIT
ncbi:HERC1, partial [Symbiodinium sp. KB8]